MSRHVDFITPIKPMVIHFGCQKTYCNLITKVRTWCAPLNIKFEVELHYANISKLTIFEFFPLTQVTLLSKIIILKETQLKDTNTWPNTSTRYFPQNA
jgi:hypothetical protein